MKKKLLFLLVIFLPLISFAQTATIRGIVKDETGQPVSKAKVSLIGSSVQAVTDSVGAYELKNVPFGKNVIEVRDANALISSESLDVKEQNVILNINSHSGQVDNVNGASTEIPTLTLDDDELKESASTNVSSVNV